MSFLAHEEFHQNHYQRLLYNQILQVGSPLNFALKLTDCQFTHQPKFYTFKLVIFAYKITKFLTCLWGLHLCIINNLDITKCLK